MILQTSDGWVGAIRLPSGDVAILLIQLWPPR
jgi:hypothetical protein